MISAYVGLPGSGKSYTVVEHCILPALRAGREVVTNVALHEQAILEEAGAGSVEAFDANELVKTVDGKRVYDEARWRALARPGVVLVIDEAWRLWPAGMQAKQFPEAHASTFAEHRHMVGEGGESMEIVIVTQDLGQLAAYARQLIDTTYRTVKLDKFGADKRFRLDVFQGGQPNAKLRPRNRLRESYGTYRPEIYRLYRSHTKSVSGSAGDERSVDKRRNVLLTWRFLGLPLIALVGFGAGLWSLNHFFGGGTVAESPERPTGASAATTPSRGAERFLPRAPAQPPARIGGWIRTESGSGHAVVLASGRAYYVPLAQCWEEWANDWRCTWRGETISE